MSKISNLAQALHQKTMEKKIKWEINDELSISTSIGINSIVVEKFDTMDHSTAYNISIENLEGKTVDEESFYPDETIYKFIAEMMVKARRDSLRADETLDELMEKINRL